MSKIDDALLSIYAIGDTTERALAAGGLVSTLLRIKNVQPIIVGQLAYECYAQASDSHPAIQFQTKTPHLPMRIVYEVMSEMLHGQGHQRDWNLLGIDMSFGGQFISPETNLCRDVQTDFGIASLMPAEQLVAELVVATNVTAHPDAMSAHRAKRLMALALQGVFELDWTKLREIADSENFRVGELVAQMRQEAKADLDASKPPSSPLKAGVLSEPGEDDLPSTKKKTSRVLPATEAAP